MATYEFEVDICLGFSHSGGVYNSGYGEVELSDEEVDQLVALMKGKDTSDVGEMDLEKELPEIYKKLDAAYRDAAYDAEEEHWLEEGYYHLECHNYEDSVMIDYIKEKGDGEFGSLNTMKKNSRMKTVNWMRKRYLMPNATTFM